MCVIYHCPAPAKVFHDRFLILDQRTACHIGASLKDAGKKCFGINHYWTATGTYESIKQPIDMDFDGLKEKVITMLGGGRCSANTSRFQNDMTTFQNADDVLTLLIHLGYLGYDSIRKQVYIPNKEIRDEFVNAIDGSKWSLTYAAIGRSEKFLEATLDSDAETVAECIAKVHEDNTSILTCN